MMREVFLNRFPVKKTTKRLITVVKDFSSTVHVTKSKLRTAEGLTVVDYFFPDFFLAILFKQDERVFKFVYFVGPTLLIHSNILAFMGQ